MWHYEQATGKMRADNGILIGTGWSGHDEGRNNPAMQQVHNLGPIPQGLWRIWEWHEDYGDFGPVVAILHPQSVTNTFGRAGFLIHGASAIHPGESSHGCIILPRADRMVMQASGDMDLVVE